MRARNTSRNAEQLRDSGAVHFCNRRCSLKRGGESIAARCHRRGAGACVLQHLLHGSRLHKHAGQFQPWGFFLFNALVHVTQPGLGGVHHGVILRHSAVGIISHPAMSLKEVLRIGSFLKQALAHAGGEHEGGKGGGEGEGLAQDVGGRFHSLDWLCVCGVGETSPPLPERPAASAAVVRYCASARSSYATAKNSCASLSGPCFSQLLSQGRKPGSGSFSQHKAAE